MCYNRGSDITVAVYFIFMNTQARGPASFPWGFAFLAALSLVVSLPAGFDFIHGDQGAGWILAAAAVGVLVFTLLGVHKAYKK